MKSRIIRNGLKKYSVLVLASLLGFSFVTGDYSGKASVGQAMAEADPSVASVSYSDVTGSMNFHDLQTSNFSAAVMGGTEAAAGSFYETRTVVVSFSGDSMIDAAGGADLGAYQNSFSGQMKEIAIENTHKQFYNELSKEGIAYEKVYSFKNIDNAVAIKIDTSFVSDIKSMDGVESVIVCDSYAAPKTVDVSSSATVNATSVYATGVYDSSAYVEEYGGKGMTVAILDTGIDYTHDAFILTDDPDDYYYEYSEKFRENMRWSESDIEAMKSALNLNATGNVYVSDKVPFAFDYADYDDDVYPSYSNHGTHVAGIIAGRAASYTDKDGNLVYAEGYDKDSVTYTKAGYDYIFADEDYTELATQEFIGVAPYAQLVICKVFTDDLESEDIGGATTEDILAALEDCVTLGVDVINMSLGTTNGFSSTNDGDDEGKYLDEVYSSVKEAGISLICAASNEYSSGYGSAFGTNLASNPDSGTVGSPSTYAAAMSVASISGKTSEFLVANAGTENQTSVYFRQAADENSVDYDFVAQMMELGKNNKYYNSSTGVLTVKYVAIPGVGLSTNYTSTIKKAITTAHEEGYLIIALIKRGNNTFQNKVENAMAAGADAVITYNNVAGEIKMTIGDIDDPVPAISTTQVTGQALADAVGSDYTGLIDICPSYTAGPFMSDFSSWGVTSDLKLKPEITAHGGEITSSVPGGYSEMSGTSMATPNVTGLMANILSYIKQNYGKFFEGEYNQERATQLAYQLMMSTATTVYDSDGLPYSPRKQGAGLASLDNIVSTKAYLYTVDGEKIDSANGSYIVDTGARPKIELGEDENKVGEYTLVYYLNNVGAGDMTFTLKSLCFTESLSLDGLAVAEQAHMLSGNAVWSIDGKTYSDGDKVTFGQGVTKITVKLALTDEEKRYIDQSFVNGMFVEGFLQLISQDDGQCSLSIPYVAFYGDWESSPMLDYDAYEIAKIEADTSIDDEDKASATVWATQAYATYWNGKYVIPMGSFLYLQDEDADQVYASEEYAAISCYNDEFADAYSTSSYMTSYAIRGLYAGLLRNARYVNVTMTDVSTGEVIYTKIVYRVGKAVAAGGSTTPAYVKMELTPDELGLVESGQYKLEFNFFFQSMDEEITEDNTYSFSFYVDYSAPVLENASVRYVDYKDASGNEHQRAYLDLDVYDNHYAMAALLCYYTENAEGEKEAVLATEYVTPILNAVRNGITTVSIEITDLLELIEQGLELYLELDDYSMNHTIYALNFNTAMTSVLPDDFTLSGAEGSGSLSVSIGKLETYTVSLDWDKAKYPSANLSNFTWSVVKGGDCVAVKNGEIVGLKAGSATVRVRGGAKYYDINVTVTDSGKTLTTWPAISFGTIYNSADVPVKASGVVSVNIEQEIKLAVEYDPWYYEYVADADKKAVELVWESSDNSVADVDGEGNVTIKKKGSVIISATINGTAYAATVTLNVQEAFTVASNSLTDYVGAGGVVYIPTDMNIMSIGNEAFKFNTSITAVVIPKTVTTIGERAFYGCTNLKYVFFDDVTAQDIADCDLTLINREAFAGCTSLEYIDFSNCKTFTVAKNAFQGCTGLQIIKGIEKIGTAYNFAFSGCTNLVGSLPADGDVEFVNSIIYNDGTTATELTGLKTLVANTAATDIRNVRLEISDTVKETVSACTLNVKKTSEMLQYVNTLDITGLHVSGSYVFADCDSLKALTIDEFTSIGYGMFYGCDSLESVTIKTAIVSDYAFYDCSKLVSVTFDGVTNGSIGKYAFASKYLGNLSNVTFNEGVTIKSIGDNAFANNGMSTFTLPEGLSYLGDNLFIGGDLKNIVLDSDLSAITFAGSTFNGISNITLKEGLEALVIEGNLLYNKDKTKVILALSDAAEYTVADTVKEIGSYAFANKQNLKSVALPQGLTSIGDYAFYNTGLESVAVPAGVKTIGEGAFNESYSLAGVTFADGILLETVGAGAFQGTAITSLALPSSVTEVGSYAFADTSLTSFNYQPAQNAVFGGYVFANCTDLTSVALADNIISLGDGTFYGCTSLTTVVLPSVEEMGSYTFFRCLNIESVTYGENAKVTGNNTFYSYSRGGETQSYDYLTSVTLGKKTTAIGDMAFIYCTALESIDLSNIKSIGNYSFWYNTSLKNVKGLGNVEYIGEYSFYGCSSIADIDISSAKVIGDYAFYGNAAETITIPATLAASSSQTVTSINGTKYSREIEDSYVRNYSSLGVGAFANAENLKKFIVAEGNADYFADKNGVLYRVISDGVYELVVYPSALALSSYSVLDGTSRIGAYSFAYLTTDALKSVTIPYETTNIGAGAFYSSGVTSYNFTSYYAPALEAEVSYETLSDSDDFYNYYMTYMSNTPGGIYRGLYNTNFDSGIINYAENLVYVYYNGYTGESYQEFPVASELTMTYPANGTGYTNYIYSTYFGNAKTSGTVLTSASAVVAANLTSSDWYSVEVIKSWASASGKEIEELKATVTEFSEFVKATHLNYNNMKNDSVQVQLLTEKLAQSGVSIDLLSETEQALSQVKPKFGITVAVASLEADATSYKSEYKVGDYFDMTGLKVVVTYDDYSETVYSYEGGQLELDALSNVALTIYHNSVTINIPDLNKTVYVRITVSEDKPDDGNDKPNPDNPNPDNPDPDNPESGCGAGCGSSGGLLIGTAVFIIVAAMIVVRRCGRFNKKESHGVPSDKSGDEN